MVSVPRRAPSRRPGGGAAGAEPVEGGRTTCQAIQPVDAEVHEGPFEALLPAWKELYSAQPGATPFMSPGWAASWWPHYGTDASVFSVVVRDGGAVVGLAPLVRRRKGPLRVLEPVGMDPGDYWDVLAAPGRADA